MQVLYPVAGDTVPLMFDTFDGGTGASITMTGLAVTDVEVYKDGGTTQRASDNGYTLLDTDGIDFDGITGIHGISIDLSDNSDAGFYAADAWYDVVISTITIDGQTVSFLLAKFRIQSATRGMAGTALPDAAADAAGGLPISDAGGLDLDNDVANQLAAIHLDHLLAVQYDPTAEPGVSNSWVNQISENGSGATRFTANALGNVPSKVTEALGTYDPPTRAELTTDINSVLTRLGTPAGADVSTDIASIKSDTAATLADTNEIQTDLANGGRLDLIFDAILVDTGTSIPAVIATAQSDLDILTGTDGATLATTQPNYAPNTVVPDAAGTAAGLHATTDGLITTADAAIDAVATTIGVAGAGLTDLGGMSTGMKAEVNAEADTAVSDAALATAAELAIAKLYAGRLLCIAAGNLSNAQNAAEQYTITLNGVAYTVTAAGLDADGNRGTTVFGEV